MTGNLSEKNIEDVYPMSDIELGMVYHSLKNPGSSVYHTQTVFQHTIKAFDPGIFKKAMILLVEKHPILRTVFDMYSTDEPVQIVFKTIRTDIEHYDISHLEKEKQEDFVKRKIKEDKQKSFDFDPKNINPLWRIKTFLLTENKICFMWVCHHAIMDGWSSASLMTELNNIYFKLKSDPYFIPQKLKISYKEFVIQQIIQKENPAALLFWEKELEDYKRLEITTAVKNSDRHEIKTLRRNLGETLLAELKRTAKINNTSVQDLCFAAYFYMLGMLSYENDLVVGYVTNNRPVCEDGEKIIGCFLNTVPVRMKIPGYIKWRDYIGMVKNKLVELKKYDRLSLFEIKKIIGEGNQDENPIFDTLFNFIDFHVYNYLQKDDEQMNGQASDKQNMSIENSVTINTLLDLHINITSSAFNFLFYYSNSIVSDELALNLSGYFEGILNKFIYSPEEPARKEELIPVEEKQKLLHQFNRKKSGLPSEKVIHELFEQQEKKGPAYIAVVYNDHRLTYRKLNEKSNQLTALLRAKGVNTDSIVGIMADRSLEMIMGILAIIKAGGAYLPIDAQYPGERKKYMIEKSKVRQLLTNYDMENESADLGEDTELIDIREKNNYQGNINNLENISKSQDLVYVIFTSGSTGKPKGVMLEHQNLVNLINHQNKYTNINFNRVLQFNTISFDVSFQEIFSTLLNGGILYLIDEDTRRNIPLLFRIVEKNEIKTLFFPASFLRIVFNDHEYVNQIPRGIEHMITAGEQVIVNDAFKKYLIDNHVNLHNHYGPSETHVVTALTLNPSGHIPVLPSLGEPLSNTWIYILDKRNHLLPIGVPGELCIGGIQVGRGYLNNPELTAQKFINYKLQNTSCKQSTDLKKRQVTYDKLKTTNKKETNPPQYPIYLTGDLARWLPGGRLEFIGRIDNQVKIRGFRVETGEIENQLLIHKEIKEAVVLPGKNEANETYLFAYIVSAGYEKGEEKPNSIELREYLSRTLPDYMIPPYFVYLEKIPLTPNSKIDRKALAKINPTLAKPESDYVPPRTEIEKKMVSIWKELLKVDRVGMQDNFFALGGDSIKLTQLTSKLNKTFGKNISVVTMFKYPTIGSFFTYFHQNPASESSNVIEGDRNEERDEGKKRMKQRLIKRGIQVND